MVTIHDVAGTAGVSPETVGRVPSADAQVGRGPATSWSG